jgi:sodium transport system permease protein
MREILRDRRSLLSGLLYGVWGPLVMGLALSALARDRADEQVRIAAAGLDQAPALTAFLDAQGVRIEPLSADVRAVLRTRRVPVVLVVEAGYERDLAASRPAKLTLAFDGAWTTSTRQGGRLRAMLSEFAQRGHDARLVLRGVAPTAVRPLRVVERDYSTAAGRAATVLGTLPMFLLLSAFIGGMSVAADVMAGERERGSLEALLVHPVSRRAVVIGKWAAVCAVTLATLAVTIVVASGVLTHPRVQSMDLPIGLTGAEAWAIAVALMPLALAASAVQLLVALRTLSYKEAQTQLSYLMFVPMVPGFLFAFGALDVAPWMTMTPILGQHLVIADILRGEAVPYAASGRLALLTLGVTVAALASCAWLLGRESVLGRQGR